MCTLEALQVAFVAHDLALSLAPAVQGPMLQPQAATSGLATLCGLGKMQVQLGGGESDLQQLVMLLRRGLVSTGWQTSADSSETPLRLVSMGSSRPGQAATQAW